MTQTVTMNDIERLERNIVNLSNKIDTYILEQNENMIKFLSEANIILQEVKNKFNIDIMSKTKAKNYLQSD